MGYDYSKKFLDANAETVIQLTELYNTQGITSRAFDDIDSMERVRLLVSNILASLALNYPKQYTDLRDKIRTWTQWDKANEQWVLFIGAPRHKVSGRKPGLLPSKGQNVYGPPAQTGRMEETYSKLIDTKEQFEDFAKWVATLGPAVERVTAELVDPPDNDRFLKIFKAVGWKADMDGPTTISLKRPKTRLEDRNA